MKTHKKTAFMTIVIIATFVVGYFAGTFIGWPKVDINNTKGDIGKLRNGQRDVAVNINTDFDRQLLSDSSLLNQSEWIQRYILTRSAEFATLVKHSVEATQNIPEFENINADMKQLLDIGFNVQAASIKAIDALELLKNRVMVLMKTCRKILLLLIL